MLKKLNWFRLTSPMVVLLTNFFFCYGTNLQGTVLQKELLITRMLLTTIYLSSNSTRQNETRKKKLFCKQNLFSDWQCMKYKTFHNNFPWHNNPYPHGVCRDVGHSVHWGINPPQKQHHAIFLVYFLWKNCTPPPPFLKKVTPSFQASTSKS